MGFKFNKHIKLGKGLGINISKSGISPSYRTKRGSISRKGYSIKTGISGLSYGKRFSKGKGCLMSVMLCVSIGALSLVMSCSEEDDNNSNCPTKRCSDFATQSEAQSTFDGNRECYKNLDTDNDNLACENLPD